MGLYLKYIYAYTKHIYMVIWDCLRLQETVATNIVRVCKFKICFSYVSTLVNLRSHI